jgi:hypothetical protein
MRVAFVFAAFLKLMLSPSDQSVEAVITMIARVLSHWAESPTRST